jgi:hypothetical protein
MVKVYPVMKNRRDVTYPSSRAGIKVQSLRCSCFSAQAMLVTCISHLSEMRSELLANSRAMDFVPEFFPISAITNHVIVIGTLASAHSLDARATLLATPPAPTLCTGDDDSKPLPCRSAR